MIPYGFLTSLETTKVREASSHGRAQWKLLTDMGYHSKLQGLIVVPAGFVTDFASVPRLPLMYWLFGDTAHASAVVHDYLCRNWVPAGMIEWREAAEVFREAMKHEGVPAWRRWLMYQAVAGADPARPWDKPQ
jgi:hypothetical protein